MSLTALVPRHGPKPISLTEFRDALGALCRFRLSAARHARHARPRRIEPALAVSGGVDSMAMAFLFSSLLKSHPGFSIADHPAHGACGIVIDHQLRQASGQEAACVAQELKTMGLQACVKRLDWSHVTKRGLDPTRLSNLEGMARTMRYQALGSACRSLQASSLFFAHHCDDQYETVLMRLLAGHGYRGLQGIQEANAIPECYELHGVYKSGLLDDQMQRSPLGFQPSNKSLQRLRVFLGDDCKGRPGSPSSPYLAPLNCEDGGIVIYRPLLSFDKDRLIATCEANKVRWFEDHTNLDPTLTTRNAVRHLTRAHRLPMALQKPSILSLCKRAKHRTSLEEAEGHRLLVREAVICHFDPNAGTLTVELPAFLAHPSPPRRLLILAMAIRKLIDFVTPELHLPPLGSLENVVDRLSPELCTEPNRQPPKAFSIAGVKFEPIVGRASTKWLLSRAPYPSSRALPERKLPGHLRGPAPGKDGPDEPPTVRHAHWRSWEMAQLWDGRFWIRIRACVPASFRILPFLPEHAKSFRLALPREERSRLEQVLKRHAPGKVRYSLPALYAVQEAGAGKGTAHTLTLLALPSLGIHVPGLERWAQSRV
ncbi:PP-loop family protein [Hirsutella rhossiliensis]|uniref:tRNA(Ile)-lysidine synthetase n=1 Tax=Hirsutella rhossiliensis TaxID=111463 RepID=A0A9P8SNV3_9HYPO|nr:PP-loop family domain-containing protein [Hirsutella rhossiliensis]KAH0968270.1 PP-loop family domain-containing protein [Hirsutella rhossiliensis]